MGYDANSKGLRAMPMRKRHSVPVLRIDARSISKRIFLQYYL
jgi:hypothetical protein